MLSFCYVGNVGYVGYGKKSLSIPVRAPIPDIIAIMITLFKFFKFN
jgi:hypothetical protein